MQSVNDDMDELFRQAAEGYPLATSGASWEKVATALGQQPGILPAKKNNSRKLLWLLCLLPLGLVCNRLMPVHTIQKNETVSTGSLLTNRAHSSGNASLVTENPLHQSANRTIIPIDVALTQTRSKAQERGASVEKEKQSVIIFSHKNSQGQKYTAPIESENPVTDILPHRKASPLSLMKPFSATPAFSSAIARTSLTSPKAAAFNLKQKKFYLFLTGGPDATTIYFQHTNRAGYHYGGGAGYQFSPRWSAEASLLLDHKYYYTEGDYFNTSKVYLPPNSKITEVNGDCSLLEISLMGYYHFVTRQHSGWFAGAGFSSYIMKKEHYNYLCSYTTSGAQVYYDKGYQNSSRNLFSVAQLSGGYNHDIGRNTSLRIEPYVKLPLTGMGSGKLPLLSTGFNISVSRALF